MERFVYADNAATTPVSLEVINKMLPCFTENWGNPSSLYGCGRASAEIVSEARENIASILSCKPSEIFFTASGTESDNWAIKGTARANIKKGKHIISTKIEHPAVLNSLASLEKEGWEVTYIGTDESGIVCVSDIEKAIRSDTILIAVMYANNEIGTIQPIKEIAKIAKQKKITFFTDAVQAAGNIPLNVNDLGIDLLAISGHKIHAPKGIGILYIKSGTRIFNHIDGGGQERGRRGGTENTPYIAGFAEALKNASEKLPDMERVRAMRDRLADEITKKIPRCNINGDMKNRLPGNINFAFECIEGESLVLLLDMAGICASTGSACSTNSLEPSHVLLAIGLPAERAHGSLRISLSADNTDEDIDYIIEKLPPIVARLRDMSPLWNDN